MDKIERLIEYMKMQAEVFLLDAQEFFPFGTGIDKDNNGIPIIVQVEKANDRPKSEPLIELLEKNIKDGIVNGKYIIGALAYDIFITENEEKFDAIMICIYKNDNFEKRHFKYYIHDSYVEFLQA